MLATSTSDLFSLGRPFPFAPLFVRSLADFYDEAIQQPGSVKVRLFRADMETGAATDLFDAGELLAGAITDLMRRTGMPIGLGTVGYGPDDVDDLVNGTLPRQRATKLSPRPAGRSDLQALFLDAMRYWQLEG